MNYAQIQALVTGSFINLPTPEQTVDTHGYDVGGGMSGKRYRMPVLTDWDLIVPGIADGSRGFKRKKRKTKYESGLEQMQHDLVENPHIRKKRALDKAIVSDRKRARRETGSRDDPIDLSGHTMDVSGAPQWDDYDHAVKRENLMKREGGVKRDADDVESKHIGDDSKKYNLSSTIDHLGQVLPPLDISMPDLEPTMPPLEIDMPSPTGTVERELVHEVPEPQMPVPVPQELDIDMPALEPTMPSLEVDMPPETIGTVPEPQMPGDKGAPIDLTQDAPMQGPAREDIDMPDLEPTMPPLEVDMPPETIGTIPEPQMPGDKDAPIDLTQDEPMQVPVPQPGIKRTDDDVIAPADVPARIQDTSPPPTMPTMPALQPVVASTIGTVPGPQYNIPSPTAASRLSTLAATNRAATNNARWASYRARYNLGGPGGTTVPIAPTGTTGPAGMPALQPVVATAPTGTTGPAGMPALQPVVASTIGTAPGPQYNIPSPTAASRLATLAATNRAAADNARWARYNLVGPGPGTTAPTATAAPTVTIAPPAMRRKSTRWHRRRDMARLALKLGRWPTAADLAKHLPTLGLPLPASPMKPGSPMVGIVSPKKPIVIPPPPPPPPGPYDSDEKMPDRKIKLTDFKPHGDPPPGGPSGPYDGDEKMPDLTQLPAFKFVATAPGGEPPPGPPVGAIVDDDDDGKKRSSLFDNEDPKRQQLDEDETIDDWKTLFDPIPYMPAPKKDDPDPKPTPDPEPEPSDPDPKPKKRRRRRRGDVNIRFAGGPSGAGQGQQSAVNPVSQVHPSQQVSVSAPRGGGGGGGPGPVAGLTALMKRIDDLLKEKAEAKTKTKRKKALSVAKKTYTKYRKQQIANLKASHKDFKKKELAKIRKMPLKQRAALRKQLKERLKKQSDSLKSSLPSKIDESSLRQLSKTTRKV